LYGDNVALAQRREIRDPDQMGHLEVSRVDQPLQFLIRQVAPASFFIVLAHVSERIRFYPSPPNGLVEHHGQQADLAVGGYLVF